MKPPILRYAPLASHRWFISISSQPGKGAFGVFSVKPTDRQLRQWKRKVRKWERENA